MKKSQLQDTGNERLEAGDGASQGIGTIETAGDVTDKEEKVNVR
jgi:hypothetical protein